MRACVGVRVSVRGQRTAAASPANYVRFRSIRDLASPPLGTQMRLLQAKARKQKQAHKESSPPKGKNCSFTFDFIKRCATLDARQKDERKLFRNYLIVFSFLSATARRAAALHAKTESCHSSVIGKPAANHERKLYESRSEIVSVELCAETKGAQSRIESDLQWPTLPKAGAWQLATLFRRCPVARVHFSSFVGRRADRSLSRARCVLDGVRNLSPDL